MKKRQGISQLRGTVGYSKGISDDLYHCNELGAFATTVPRRDLTVGAKMYIVLFDKTAICLSLSITMGQKTYNSGYSLVVTHLTTNPPVRCLNRAERTGSLVVSCPFAKNALKHSVYSKWVSRNRKHGN